MWPLKEYQIRGAVENGFRGLMVFKRSIYAAITACNFVYIQGISGGYLYDNSNTEAETKRP